VPNAQTFEQSLDVGIVYAVKIKRLYHIREIKDYKVVIEFKSTAHYIMLQKVWVPNYY